MTLTHRGGQLADRYGRMNVLYPTTLISGILCFALWLPSNGAIPVVVFSCFYGASLILALFSTLCIRRTSPLFVRLRTDFQSTFPSPPSPSREHTHAPKPAHPCTSLRPGLFSGAFISVCPAAVGQISPTSRLGARIGTFFGIVAFATLLGTPVGGAFVKGGGSASGGGKEEYRRVAVFSVSSFFIPSFSFTGVERVLEDAMSRVRMLMAPFFCLYVCLCRALWSRQEGYY